MHRVIRNQTFVGTQPKQRSNSNVLYLDSVDCMVLFLFGWSSSVSELKFQNLRLLELCDIINLEIENTVFIVRLKAL